MNYIYYSGVVICVYIVILTTGSVFAVSINATITPGIFVPYPPLNLAVSINDRAVDLSWSTPSSNGGTAITDYVIEYKLTSGGSWSVFLDGVSVNTFTTVTGLTNDTSYDFRVLAVNSVGQGEVSSEVNATPGPPAQVIIQNIDDTTVPSISADIRITNEGGIAYEYQYTWCVTDSDTNLCGGGDDIFSSSAAKFINPGENFDTTLSATVYSIGSYWFHLEVDFGSDSSNANQSFTATTESVSGSGSGGGGGGSVAVRAPSGNIPISADFNSDNKVDSVDFSILLAFWKQVPPFKNPYVDINKDNRVDSIDFSILLYKWGN